MKPAQISLRDNVQVNKNRTIPLSPEISKFRAISRQNTGNGTTLGKLFAQIDCELLKSAVNSLLKSIEDIFFGKNFFYFSGERHICIGIDSFGTAPASDLGMGGVKRSIVPLVFPPGGVIDGVVGTLQKRYWMPQVATDRPAPSFPADHLGTQFYAYNHLSVKTKEPVAT